MTDLEDAQDLLIPIDVALAKYRGLVVVEKTITVESGGFVASVQLMIHGYKASEMRPATLTGPLKSSPDRAISALVERIDLWAAAWVTT